MSPREQLGAAAPAKRDHRQEVTDSIVKMLEDGVAPWQKPWESAGMPINPTTDKAYRGGNAVHLMATGLSRGYEDPRWMTYKQAAENGWQVRKGEKGTHIEFWEVKAKPEEKNGEPDRKGSEEAAKENQRRLIHRVYTVFNAKQIDGVPPFEREQRSAFEAVQSGERILTNSGAKITHDQRDNAFYRPSTDSIHLPPKEAFKDAPGYYGTALHELSHWTGHPSRMNRPTLNESYRFGDLNYAKEELRAELASVFIAAEVGVPHDPANHAAYVGSWIKALKEDKNEIFRAAHDASAATDFVLSLEREVSRAEALEIGNSAATDIEKTQVIRDETEALENDRDLVGSAESNLSTGGQESTRFVARFESQTGTVAVHDKRLGADQHTPVATLTELNGDIRAVGASSPKNPIEKTSPDGLSASFAAARSITAEKLGDAARTFTAQIQSGNYRGEIIGETDLHFVQRLSPNSAVAHMKHLLQPVPRVGDNVGIGYANELGSVTAGFRASRGQLCFKFSPVEDGTSSRFNPLAEVRLFTPRDVSDAQNIADMIIRSGEDSPMERHWEDSAASLTTGMILHACYTAAAEDRIACLADLSGLFTRPGVEFRETLNEMVCYPHDTEYRHGWRTPSGLKTSTHPVVSEKAQEMLDKESKELSGVLSTAKTALALYSDPLVARNTAASDFTINDLVNDDRPVSLYLVVPPSDKIRLRRLIRLMFTMVVNRLTERMAFDGSEQKRNKHRLLFLIDEFPSLNRMEIFADALSYMAGYGLKAYLITQDIRQIVDAYGQNESIVSNCHVRIAFAPNQVETAELLSKMTGTTTVQKASFNFSGSRFSPVMSHVNASVDHIERPLMTPDEVMRLRPPKKEGSGDSEVITVPGDMLIFVSGHFPILGMQMLYFADPELARRSAIPPPEATQRQIPAKQPVQIDKPEFVTDEDVTTGLERGFVEELRRP